jgi:type I restriction enzyme S subunit
LTDGPFGSNLKRAHYVDSGPRVIRLQNIGFGEFIDERAHITEQHFETLRAHEVRAGDLVVASLGQELPRACLIPQGVGPAIVKADCIRARLHPALDARYMNYALQRPKLRQTVADQIHGVGRPRLGMQGIKNLTIPLAPRGEQARIVAAIEEHLSRLDVAEAAALSATQRIDAMERSIISEATSTLDPPQHWKVITVADAGVVKLGLQRSPKRHNGPNMRPYLRVANVFEDRIDDSDVMSMNMTEEEWGRYKLQDGDVLLNEGQSPELLGRPAIYRGDPPDVAFTNSLIRFQANENVDPEWALLVFRSHMHNRRFMQESQITTNIAHLAAGRFKTVEFPVPPLREQQERVLEARAGLDACARLRSGVEAARKRATNLRRSILAAAFSGQLAPQDPDDEPASVLLDRIRAEREAAAPARKRKARS